MDNENSIAYHFGQIIKISIRRMKEISNDRGLAVQCGLTVLYQVLLTVLAFIFMSDDSGTLLVIGLVLAAIYNFGFFIVNISKHIPWQVFWIFTAGAAVNFILNVTHVVPEDVSIVFRGFDQSLWCALIVLQVIVLFLFTLIPYLVYRRKSVKTVQKQIG